MDRNEKEKKRRDMWRTSNTNGHLENHTDIGTYRSFLNIYTCMKGIYTIEKKMSQLLMPPRKTSGARNGLNLVHKTIWKCPTPQVTAKAIGCALQPSAKVLLLKTTLTYVSTHGEVQLAPDSKLCPY